MRIISGYLKGRTIESPHNNKTHPMSEKMRGALFNALGDISELTILDPFAGTGACSIEAISRGANYSTMLEVNPLSFKVLNKNVYNLGLEDKVYLKRINCKSWSENNYNEYFNIIICDPPYKPQEINLELVFKLSKHLKLDGIFVVSAPPSQDSTVKLRASNYPNLKLMSHKTYADGSLYFYKNKT